MAGDLSRWGVQNPRINFKDSNETLSFEALITRDDEPALLATNDGRGGQNMYFEPGGESDPQAERQAKQELRDAVGEVVSRTSDHKFLRHGVTDLWVSWKLTGESKGVSFEDTIKQIEAQMKMHEQPVEEGLIESILEAREKDEDRYIFAVLDRDGKVLKAADDRVGAEAYVSKKGGKLGKGLSIWMKEKGKNQPKVGDIINKEEVKFGQFSNPAKMPCKSLSYPAGNNFTCPRGAKLMKYPGTVCYFCYGADGLYIMPTVKLAQDRRMKTLQYSKRFPKRQEEWVGALVTKIGRMRNPYFRWNETGDIQDATHWEMVLEVVRRTPNIHHWIPSKEQPFLNSWIDENGVQAIPSNLNIRVSGAWIGDRIRVRQPMTTSSVSDPEAGDAVKDPGYKCPATWQHEKTDGKCQECRACWTRSVPNVDYLLHVGTKQATKRKDYLAQRKAGKKRGQITAPE